VLRALLPTSPTSIKEFLIMRTKFVVPVAVTALGLALAGCSNDSSSMPSLGSDSPASSAQAKPGVVFNDADVKFLQDMFPHHAQAVEMAKMVQGRTTTPDIVALSTAIEGAQQPEMDQMTSLLASFGKPAPSADMGGMAGMSGMSSSSSTNGMMSSQDMTALMGLSGAEFDKRWLTMMTAHHKGAIGQAKTELAGGQNADAKALATKIIDGQQAELTQMGALLAKS